MKKEDILDRMYDPDFLRMRRKVEYHVGILRSGRDVDFEDLRDFLASPLEYLSRKLRMDRDEILRIMEEYSIDHLDILTAILFEKLKKLEKQREDEYTTELVKKLKRVDPIRMDENLIIELAEELRTLGSEEIRTIGEKFTEEGVHPYIVRVLTDRKSRRSGVVIDGSNVYHLGFKPSLSNFERLFLSMAEFKMVLFPFRIVFDRNITYILRADERIKFERSFMKSGKIFLHSPADELIMEMARSMKAFVISKDRFEDYPTDDVRILTLNDDFKILEAKP